MLTPPAFLDPDALPTTRADCQPDGVNEQQPWPFMGCRFHLTLDVHPASATTPMRYGAAPRLAPAGGEGAVCRPRSASTIE